MNKSLYNSLLIGRTSAGLSFGYADWWSFESIGPCSVLQRVASDRDIKLIHNPCVHCLLFPHEAEAWFSLPLNPETTAPQSGVDSLIGIWLHWIKVNLIFWADMANPSGESDTNTPFRYILTRSCRTHPSKPPYMLRNRQVVDLSAQETNF